MTPRTNLPLTISMDRPPGMGSSHEEAHRLSGFSWYAERVSGTYDTWKYTSDGGHVWYLHRVYGASKWGALVAAIEFLNLHQLVPEDM